MVIHSITAQVDLQLAYLFGRYSNPYEGITQLQPFAAPLLVSIYMDVKGQGTSQLSGSVKIAVQSGVTMSHTFILFGSFLAVLVAFQTSRVPNQIPRVALLANTEKWFFLPRNPIGVGLPDN